MEERIIISKEEEKASPFLSERKGFHLLCRPLSRLKISRLHSITN